MQTHHFRSSVTLCSGDAMHRPYTKTSDAWRRPTPVNAYAPSIQKSAFSVGVSSSRTSGAFFSLS